MVYIFCDHVFVADKKIKLLVSGQNIIRLTSLFVFAFHRPLRLALAPLSLRRTRPHAALTRSHLPRRTMALAIADTSRAEVPKEPEGPLILVPEGFSLYTENNAHILISSKDEAFLNPVQEFNRDMSVACIRVWSEEMDREKEDKFRRAEERRAKRLERAAWEKPKGESYAFASVRLFHPGAVQLKTRRKHLIPRIQLVMHRPSTSIRPRIPRSRAWYVGRADAPSDASH